MAADDEPVLKLTAVKKVRKVEIDGEPYTVSELTGPEQAAWNDWMKTRVDKKGSLKTSRGFYAKLLSMTVRDKEGKLVSIEFVEQNWNASLQQQLHEIADSLSLLTKKAQEEVEGNS